MSIWPAKSACAKWIMRFVRSHCDAIDCNRNLISAGPVCDVVVVVCRCIDPCGFNGQPIANVDYMRRKSLLPWRKLDVFIDACVCDFELCQNQSVQFTNDA